MEQKKIHRWRENFRWNKHAPFLASWIGLGQAQGGGDKMYKKKLRQIEASLLGSPTLMPRGCTILCLPNRTLSWRNCNTGLPFQIFAAVRQNRGNHTLPWHIVHRGCPAGSDGEKYTCNAGDPGSIPGSERSPGERNSYALQYSYLENFKDRGAWQQGRKESDETEWLTPSYNTYIYTYMCVYSITCEWKYWKNSEVNSLMLFFFSVDLPGWPWKPYIKGGRMAISLVTWMTIDKERSKFSPTWLNFTQASSRLWNSWPPFSESNYFRKLVNYFSAPLICKSLEELLASFTA